MNRCPSEVELEQHATEELPEDERAEVARHLGACPSCAARLVEIAKNLEDQRFIQGICRPTREDEPTAAAARLAESEAAAVSTEDAATASGANAAAASAANVAAASAASASNAHVDADLPLSVGPFQIVGELGRGGMGVVYLARQSHPRRQVALKVVRPTLATSEVERRFRKEADLLAQLQHPGIAQIFEAGVATMTLANGRTEDVPYFAMEHVEGVPVDEFVRRTNASIPERLELLARIGDAVHHAHQRGVVHRDLKPANILVCTRGALSSAPAHTPAPTFTHAPSPAPAPTPTPAPGEPKILDFGVARVIDSGETMLSSATLAGQIVGTLPFMSPEQVSGLSGRIDARSDVYSLGVLGYWLLADRLPYSRNDVSLVDAIQAIREEPPTSLGRIDPRLRGDVDTVICKALEKEPENRYASAAALAEDLRQCARDRPIRARPPSTLEQARRFARRNRLFVSLVASLLLVLVISAATATWLAVRATRAERDAADRLRQAQEEQARLAAVNDFLNGMLESPNAHFGTGRNVTVRDVLGEAARQLDAGALADVPAAEIELRRTLGNTLWTLGDFPSAREHFEIALRRARDAGSQPGIVFDLLGDLGLVLRDMGDLSAAASYFREAATLAEADLSGDRDRLLRANSSLGGMLVDAGQYASADTVLARVVAESADLPDHGSRLSAIHSLAKSDMTRGDPARAVERCESILESFRRSGPWEHPRTTKTLVSLGRALLAQGRVAEADSVFQEAHRLNLAIFGSEHQDVAITLHELGRSALHRGDLDAARRSLEESIAMSQRLLGPIHPATLLVERTMARLRVEQGRAEEAERLLAHVEEHQRAARGDSYPELAATLVQRGELAERSGDGAKAAACFREAARIRRETLGPEDEGARGLEARAVASSTSGVAFPSSISHR